MEDAAGEVDCPGNGTPEELTTIVMVVAVVWIVTVLVGSRLDARDVETDWDCDVDVDAGGVTIETEVSEEDPAGATGETVKPADEDVDDEGREDNKATAIAELVGPSAVTD